MNVVYHCKAHSLRLRVERAEMRRSVIVRARSDGLAEFHPPVVSVFHHLFREYAIEIFRPRLQPLNPHAMECIHHPTTSVKNIISNNGLLRIERVPFIFVILDPSHRRLVSLPHHSHSGLRHVGKPRPVCNFNLRPSSERQGHQPHQQRNNDFSGHI